jgi:conjugal transfer pilus assembly protein TrbC
VPARIDRIVVAAVFALGPCLAGAQAPQWPTAEDIDRALKANPFPSAERLGSQPFPQLPNLEPKRDAVDIEALARGKLQLAAPASSASTGSAPLRIFVTLDMPRASLALLTDQAARAGAVLVLRGLKRNSMRETLALVGDLVGKRTVAWVIDPEAFTRFGVNKAPTFVLTLEDAGLVEAHRGCSGGCAAAATFVSVSGDVSLDYALDAMLRRRPDAAPRVEPLLKRLRPS